MPFRSGALSRRDFVRIGLSVVAAPSTLACKDQAPPGIIPPRLFARPGVPTEAPVTGAITSLGLGGTRDGFYYVPTFSAPSYQFPLLVLLHGAGGRAADWQVYTARAETWRVALLAIDSRSITWDAIRGSYGPDVDFLDAALTFVFDRVPVDPAHVALAGFSDGASYGLSLGVPNGDLFSHVIGYSPGFYEGAPPRGQPKGFVSHGDQDPILPFSHTRDGIVPRMRDQGLDVTFHPFAGGHKVPAEASNAAFDWFAGPAG